MAEDVLGMHGRPVFDSCTDVATVDLFAELFAEAVPVTACLFDTGGVVVVDEVTLYNWCVDVTRKGAHHGDHGW